ncbi:MAG: 3-oxoacyl-[Lachnospiraceae bacterium]|nr:3-oxoacyl-[acyl-carrier-protein] reductase [Lachnospiraceae bacterium]
MSERKTAVVTGASRGIGKAIALELARAGYDIAAICASRIEAAEEVCEACRALGAEACAYRCDVSDGAAVKETAGAVRRDFGAVHVLVNNAGITRDTLVMTMKEADFDAVIATNLKGAFLMTQAFLPLFLRAKEGCIVNISSVVGLMGNPGQANYAAAKAGLIGMTKTVAKEYAARGIRANAVAPGFIATEMTEGLETEELLAQIPLGRMGRPEEIAQAVRFLAQADYVTGEVLRVDGGIAM